MEKTAIGIDLGGTTIKGVLMNAGGQCRHITRVPTEAEKGGTKVLENISTLIATLISKEGSKESIAGIGIGTPGFVDKNGVVSGANNLSGWAGTNIYIPLREKFGLPVYGGNDVTIATCAEARFGAGRGVDNLVCFALGTGIGGGIVTNGKLYKGTYGMAGELGHISIDPNGLPCGCGQCGCIECYASATGIVREAVRLCQEYDAEDPGEFVCIVNADPQALTAKTVYDYVKKNDPVACRVNEFACEKLARVIGIMVNTLSPDRIILGGGVMMAGQIIVDTVNKYVPQFCWIDIWKHCEIVIAELGENAGVLGAAQLAFEENINT